MTKTETLPLGPSRSVSWTNYLDRLQLLQDWTVSSPVPMPPINTGLVRGRDSPSKNAEAVPVWLGRRSIVTWKAKTGNLGDQGMKVIMASVDTCPSPIPAMAILDCPWQKLSTHRKYVTDSPAWWGKPLNVILTDDELGLESSYLIICRFSDFCRQARSWNVCCHS